MQPHILTLFVVTTACKHNRRHYPSQIFHRHKILQTACGGLSISNIKNTIEDYKYFHTKVPAETAVSTGSESQPFDYSSENRFNSAISSAQRNSSGVSRISGIFRKGGIHIFHFAYKANAPEDRLLKIGDFVLSLSMPYSAGVFFLVMKLKPPKIIRHLFPSLIWEIDDPEGVFLTFDDGPTPGITEWILAMLEKYDAKATFFVLGKNVEAYPDLVRRIVDAGHKVGNHTYSHQKGWGMSLERYIEDVDFANDLIHSELFRPPYARITPAQARALSQRYKLVMWDVLSRDYSRSLSPRKCLKNVTKHLEPGAIVVFHDSEKSFRNMRYALPRTLDKIRKLGLKCKTIEL